MRKQFLHAPERTPSCFREMAASLWVHMVSSMVPSIKAETAAVQAQDDLLNVLTRLRANESDIQGEIERLSDTLKTKKRDVVNRLHSGVLNKNTKLKAFSTLLPSIRKLRMLQSQYKVNQNRIALVMKQLEAFDNGKFQQSIVQTLKQSVSAMKQIGIGMKVDEIDDIMGDLDDSLLASNEVNEALSGQRMLSMDGESMNEDDLMRELDAWLESEDAEPLHSEDASVHMQKPSVANSMGQHVNEAVVPITSGVHVSVDATRDTDSIVTPVSVSGVIEHHGEAAYTTAAAAQAVPA